MSDPNSQPTPSERDLYAKLGEQLIALRPRAIAASGLETLSFEGQGARTDLFDIGKEYFDRVSQSAYAVICGGSSEWQTIATQGETALIGAFTGLLIAQLGLVATVATALATLIVKIFANSAGKEICAHWKASLPAVA